MELEQLIEDFPKGRDSYLGRSWIRHAVDCGSIASIEWMLSKGVDLASDDNEGYTPLHSALERPESDRYAVVELLLKRGAPIDAHGINDWTPLHMAAVREDIKALELLLRFGADPTVRTRIDHYATPLEEARNLDKQKAVQFLEKLA